MKPDDLPENMANKITINDDGCWIWTGAKTGAGYASVSHERRIHNAHRLAYILLVGEPPEGLVLDHLCRVPHCVNPEHLDPVPQAVNMQRSPLQLGNQTHCKRGHEWVEANWYRHPNGKKKQCHPCLLLLQSARNARVSAERAS